MLQQRARALEELGRRFPRVVREYSDLYPTALALLPSGFQAADPVVRLLLPLSLPDALFAGMRTAIAFGAGLALSSGRTLEVRHFDRTRSAERGRRLVQIISEIGALPTERISLRQAWQAGPQHPDDIIVPTFWETALAAKVALDNDLMRPEQVVYLVQDYEPEFYPASTQSALCRSTYHSGFTLVVNSRPLASYLEEREGVPVDSALVFRPDLDVERIAESAARREPAEHLRVAFYGRPSNARNSFDLGVASIRVAERELRAAGRAAQFVSIGERHKDIPLEQGVMRSLGKLSWDGYFDRLAKIDVMVSFQQTPHPSHPPLDAVASGAFSILNDVGGSRLGLSSRLYAVESSPLAVSNALLQVAEQVRNGGTLRAWDESFVEQSGHPLARVIAAVLQRA